MKPTSTIIIILLSCILQGTSMTVAQGEETQEKCTQQEISTEDQTKIKDIPIITNPVVFDEKDLDKLLEKQREYVEKYYPDYRIRGKGEEHDIMDGHRYSFFYLENEQGERMMTIRFDIEEAHQAYMKKHQKEIKKELEKLKKKGIISTK